MVTSAPDPETSIRVRTYAPHDHAAVVALFMAGMLEYSPMLGEIDPLFQPYIDGSINGDLAHIESTYMASGGHFWVATCVDADGAEVVVGMVGLEGKPDKAGELRRMSVRADYRRYGVGRLLVASLEQWATAQGLAKVWLSTGEPMTQAHRFYESMGYKLYKKETAADGFELFFFEKLHVQ